MPGKHDNDFKNGDIYGQPENGGAPQRNGHFGKVAPDNEPAYYEETQVFNRPGAPKQSPQNNHPQTAPKQNVQQQENYPQNAHNSYGMTQGGYPQNNPNPYGQQQSGYPQNNPNPYGQQQGGYPQNNPNPYGQQQGGYPQNNPNPYGQQQGGYPQNNPNQYGQQNGGYPQNNPNPYGQQNGGYPQNNPDPYRQGAGNPYLRERPEPVRNEQGGGNKKKGKKKQPMKTSTAVLIVVTLAIVLFGVVPATLIFLLKDKDDSGSSTKNASQTTSQTTEADTDEKEDTTEETTEEQTESDKFVAMIDVVGKSSGIAESELRDAGFKVFCKNVYSDEVPEGKVVSQNYDPGYKIARGKMVTLEVSLGPEPTKVPQEDLAEVPDVKGLKVEKAMEKLTMSGFEYEVNYVIASKDVPQNEVGTVISQSPSYGVKRQKGTKVVLTAQRREANTPVATGKVVTEETDLNVRKDNNTDAEIVGKLAKGSNVDIIYEFEGWYAILYEGEVAFVSKQYVELPENAPKIPEAIRSPRTALEMSQDAR